LLISARTSALTSSILPRVLRYDVALKTAKFVQMVHGTKDGVTNAKDIIGGTEHSSYTVHREAVLVQYPPTELLARDAIRETLHKSEPCALLG
jgi:hypothetical protein